MSGTVKGSFASTHADVVRSPGFTVLRISGSQISIHIVIGIVGHVFSVAGSIQLPKQAIQGEKLILGPKTERARTATFCYKCSISIKTRRGNAIPRSLRDDLLGPQHKREKTAGRVAESADVMGNAVLLGNSGPWYVLIGYNENSCNNRPDEKQSTREARVTWRLRVKHSRTGERIEPALRRKAWILAHNDCRESRPEGEPTYRSFDHCI